MLAERSGFEANLPNKSGEIRFPDVSLELPSRVEQTASKIGRRGNSGADHSIVTGQRRNLFGTPPKSAKLSSAAEVQYSNAVCIESSRTVAGALAFHGVRSRQPGDFTGYCEQRKPGTARAQGATVGPPPKAAEGTLVDSPRSSELVGGELATRRGLPNPRLARPELASRFLDTYDRHVVRISELLFDAKFR